MDPANPVVKLLTQGMTAESEGRFDDAQRHFQAAWDARTDDYDACMAAHYVARHQPTDADSLKWHRTALEFAEKVNDERVVAFRASLHLSIAQSAEKCGDNELARTHVESAGLALKDVPEGAYKDHLVGAHEALAARFS